jgi:hypothetical protein
MAVVMLMQTVSPLVASARSRVQPLLRRTMRHFILLFRELAQHRQRSAILPAAHMTVPPSQNK